ncbi:hypothetical protein BKA66DRAFT_572516 [Pyrenochaeta sp. MPI-SDFR-AT-0127]|nr:hypothetical protein BKA66DRAFT_572516 [Pyrenochaeta sp. MPI-SDFR-AT-0127]
MANNIRRPDEIGQLAQQQSVQTQLHQQLQQQYGWYSQQHQSLPYHPEMQHLHSYTQQPVDGFQQSSGFQHGNGTWPQYGGVSSHGFNAEYGCDNGTQSFHPPASYNPAAPTLQLTNCYPVHGYGYTAQNHQPPTTCQNSGGTAYHSRPSQQQHEHAESFWGPRPQNQPGFTQQYVSNYYTSANTAIDHTSNMMSSMVSHQCVPPHQGNTYCPTYKANHSSFLANCQPLIMNQLGEKYNQNQDLRESTKSFSTSLQHLARCHEQYPKLPTESDADAVTRSFVCPIHRYHTIEQPTVAKKAVLTHRKTSSMEKSNRKCHEKLAEQGALLQKRMETENRAYDGHPGHEAETKVVKRLSEDGQQDVINGMHSHICRDHSVTSRTLLRQLDRPVQESLQQLHKRIGDWTDQITNANTSTGHHRWETETSMLAPPPKRVKKEPMSSPASTPVNLKAPLPTAHISGIVSNGWRDFDAYIRQDDKDLVVKSHLDHDRDKMFRPEIRETYKGRDGETETALHSATVIPAAVKTEDLSDEGDEGGVRIESERC